MYKFAESEDFAEGLACNFIALPSCSVPVTIFARQETEEAMTSEEKFIHHMNREITFQVGVTPPSPLTDRSTK